MTTIDLAQFTITDHDSPVIRAAKQGCLDGIAHANQVHTDDPEGRFVVGATFPTRAEAGSGVVMLAAARRGLPVVLHTPTEVKAAVTGSGRADKAQVAAMVVRILGLETAPRPADAADALAVAICRQWRGAGSDRLAVAAASERARIAAVAR